MNTCLFFLHHSVLNDLFSEYKKLVEIKGKVNFDEWVNNVLDWKEKYPLYYDKDSNLIKPGYIIETLYELTKGDAIICTEVGQNQMWSAIHGR